MSQTSGEPVTHARALIDYDGVKFRYSEAGEYILSGLNLRIHDGEFFVLLGPSGCGKTTALNLLAGFELPVEGSVTVGGVEVRGPGPDRVVIFQGDDSLLGWLTAEENVEFGLFLAGVAKDERRERVGAALNVVGLGREHGKYPHQLSGGMKQRVQIARAFVCDSSILLMDEPFAAVDAQTRTGLQDELARLWQDSGRTVLFITHDIAEAIILGDRIGVMPARGGTSLRYFTNTLPRPRHRGHPAFGTLYEEIESGLSAGHTE